MPSMLLNSILTYDCMDAGGRATQEQLPRATMPIILLFAYNPIICLESTEFPLNDQIISGIGIR